MASQDLYKPETEATVGVNAVLIITDDKTEDLEFFYPYYRFIEAGFKVDVATPSGGAFEGKHDLGLKDSMKLADVNPSQYRVLYIPGGKAPAKLRDNKDAIAITKHFYESGKPIAAICHGAQLLAAADVINGKRISAYPEVEDEVRKARGIYVNSETVIDGQFITARWPGDLPMHMKRTLEVIGRSGLDDGKNRRDYIRAA